MSPLMQALGMVLAAASVGVCADRAARWRRPAGDRGDYWSRVIRWCIYPLLGLILLATLLADLGWWPNGWRYYLNQSDGGQEIDYRIALFTPLLAWTLALLVGLVVKPGERRQEYPSIGGIGFGNRRRWLLLYALPLGLLLAFTASELGWDGGKKYPAASWSALALLTLSLAGAAASAGRAATGFQPQASSPGRTDAALPPWPEALAAHGVQAQSLAAWAPGPPARAVSGALAQELAERLHAAGAHGVAPELIEAVAALLQPPPGEQDYGPIRLAYAPDGCGQAEVVSLAAALLDQHAHTVTLVVTARGAAELAGQLRRWLPQAAARIVALERISAIPAEALLWVTDAEFLSDRLLPWTLKDASWVRQIGMVVWWRLQDYTGVMAANLWAITRRLHRLLRMRGRHDVRTLALLRNVAHADAQLGNFVRRLLPHPLPPTVETHVGRRPLRSLDLRLLTAQPLAPTGRGGRESVAGGDYLLLRAAAASVAAGWPTCLEPPEFVSARELERFRQETAGQTTLSEQLRPDPAGAGAWLLPLPAADLLALPEMIAAAGRADPAGLERHYVGVAAPDNPYAAYLLANLKRTGDLPSSRRLVCAEACPAIIKRHVLLALNELPDTWRGLRRMARWDERAVRQILQDLAKDHQLDWREVRYLDDRDRLVVESEYQSSKPDPSQRPLDTVGLKLLEVRDPAEATPGEGVRLRVDPERVLIKAYPRRVFMRDGQRYRVRDWHSLEETLSRGWLECQREDQSRVTWRIHNAFVFRIQSPPGETAVAIGQRGRLTRLAVDLSYEEEVRGMIEWAADPSQRLRVELQRSFFDPLIQTFDTRALALCLLEPPPDPDALPSLCQALRHVLPVHLGVEEDALEVVPLSGEPIDEQETFGLVVVDLYPGGIGLIDAIHDDTDLLLRLLQWTRAWLADCPDQELQTPAARAANIDQPPQRAAALKLLDTII